MPKATKDVEQGETTPLLGDDAAMLKSLGSYRGANEPAERRGGLSTLPTVPVGGYPGNPKFWIVLEMAVRLTVMMLMIGSMVWMPEYAKMAGVDRFAKHAGLAGCLMVFFTTFTFGGVLNAASAGVSGCFCACLNTFILRGFFPDGVVPGMTSTSPAFIVGWIDLAFYNLAVLGFNCRMGFRMTAMALNVSFMMCYMNPEDATIFSKNWKIDANGAAVSAFVGVCVGSLCAILAVLLPYPLGFASTAMKAQGKQASQDTCKLFIAAVKYFKEKESSVLIDRQISHSKLLKAEIDGLTETISDAYVESFDLATQGTIRVLYETHASMLKKIFDMLEALQYALSTEDFGSSHVDCMDAIGEQAHDLVDAASVLLIAATVASEDGLIDDSEKADLQKKEDKVKKAGIALSESFHGMRKKFGKTVSKELMNESFFVFCISAFARLTVEYSDALHSNPPSGKSFITELISGIKELATVPVWYHFRVVSRYWLSLMLCFLFSAHMDNYMPSCAITGVFLINARVGPDVMAMIQGLLAVVVGIVTNALMFSFSCRFGNTRILMVVATFYWLATITVAKGSSSLAGLGLLMSALSPFALFKFCEPDTPEAAAANAIALWTGIRALLIAVVITLICEIIHVPGLFTRLTREKLNEAFEAMQVAFKNVWPEDNIEQAKDAVDAALKEVDAKLGDAATYNTACLMEPRVWNCQWKSQFVSETISHLKKVRLDVLLIKDAMCGLDGDMHKIIELLHKVPEVAHMKKDLDATLEDSRKLTFQLLDHGYGKFTGLKELSTVQGLETLDGYDDAIVGQSKVMTFPVEAPVNMEDDELVRLSIVFVMLQYLVQHTSDILKAGVKLS
jgi:hypothetical protein